MITQFNRANYSRVELKLIDLGIDDPKDIDLEAIARVEGVEVRYRDLVGCEARLVGFNDKAIVTIKKSSDERRKRFSLAHELGHWNYHRGKSFECRIDEVLEGYKSKPHLEKEADNFASELLMPKYLFLPLVQSIRRPDFDAVEILATKFNTSLTATAIRLVTMNVWPLILICHSSTGRIWFNRSKDIPERWFPKKELDADSIAFERLYSNEPRQRAQKIGADAWFDIDEADEYDIMEDTIKISNDQVLTLLWLDNHKMLNDRDKNKYW